MKKLKGESSYSQLQNELIDTWIQRDHLYISSGQQNFQWWRQRSYQHYSIKWHMWLLNTYNVANVTEELNY